MASAIPVNGPPQCTEEVVGSGSPAVADTHRLFNTEGIMSLGCTFVLLHVSEKHVAVFFSLYKSFKLEGKQNVTKLCFKEVFQQVSSASVLLQWHRFVIKHKTFDSSNVVPGCVFI